MELLFKLLRQNLNIWQLLGFTVANLLGAIIVLVGIQTWHDVDQLLQQDDHFLSSNYLVISKPVGGGSLLGSIMGNKKAPGFTEQEAKALDELSAVEGVGKFTTAKFTVEGAITFGGNRMQTEMFLESVPDNFLDVKSEEWYADFEGSFIPVILPRSYMSIYNFGFASGRGLPQVGEGMIKSFPFELTLSGNDLRRSYKGRVVGFSNRLNTILVPDDFLKQANAQLAPEAVGESGVTPSRLILSVGKDTDGALIDFIHQKGYNIDGNSEQTLRMQTLIHGIVGAVVALGLVVSLLSFYLLMISILLLIEKNRDKFSNLHALGYGIGQIARPYQLLVVLLNVVVWVLSLIGSMMAYSRLEYLFRMVNPEFETSASVVACLAAIFLCLLFLGLHLLIIYRATNRACR